MVNNGRNIGDENDFRSFKILVGLDVTKHPRKLEVPRYPPGRHLTYIGSSTPPCPAIKEMLDKANSVALIGDRSSRSLSDVGSNAILSWEVCSLEDCSEMEMILKSNTTMFDKFRYLVKLDITRLQKLVYLGGSCYVGKPRNSTLNDCPNITKIFSPEMTWLVPKLQYLTVRNCSGLVTIIEDTDNSGGFKALPKLKMLELVELPNLVSIYGNGSLVWPSLGHIYIVDCDHLQLYL